MAWKIRPALNAMVEAIQGSLRGRVRTVETLPGAFSNDNIRRYISQSPAIFVAFSRGDAVLPRNPTTHDGRFEVFILVAHQGKQMSAVAGDSKEIGVYEILETVIPLLHDMTIDDIGTLEYAGCRDLFAKEAAAVGGSLMAASFKLPMNFEKPTPADLGAFSLVVVDNDVDPSQDGEPDAIDHIELEQE